MSRRKLFPDGNWRFTVDGRKTYEDGKAYWPAILSLVLNKRDALELIMELADHARYREDEPFQIVFVGTIKQEPEEASAK